MTVRFGLHTQTLGEPARASIVRARPRVVVSTNPTYADWIRVKAEAGIELLVGRVVHDDAGIEPIPEAAAEALYHNDRATMLACTWITAWQTPWNECLHRRGELALRARAERRYCELAAADGLKIAVGGFSVGTPEPADVADEYGPALVRAAYLVLHEYWTLGRLEYPWWTGRWRRIIEALPPELRRPVLIGECGLDYHAVGQADQYAGWRVNGVEIGEYTAELDAYREQIEADVAELAKGGIVANVSACVFEVGAVSPWQSFDLADETTFEQWLAARRTDVVLAVRQNPTKPDRIRQNPTTPPRRTTVETAPLPADWAPVDLRGKLPILDPRAYPRGDGYYTRPLAGIVGTTVHYTAGGYDQTPQAIAAYQTSPSAARQTGAGQPFPGIAYTLGVSGNGTVWQFWGLDIRTWHSAARVNGLAWNAVRIGIAWFGNGDPRPEQIAGLARAHVWCERQLGRQLDVDGHKDHYPTLCPDLAWPAWGGALLQQIEVLRQPAVNLDALEGRVWGPCWKAAGEADTLGQHDLATALRSAVVANKVLVGAQAP